MKVNILRCISRAACPNLSLLVLIVYFNDKLWQYCTILTISFKNYENCERHQHVMCGDLQAQCSSVQPCRMQQIAMFFLHNLSLSVSQSVSSLDAYSADLPWPARDIAMAICAQLGLLSWNLYEDPFKIWLPYLTGIRFHDAIFVWILCDFEPLSTIIFLALIFYSFLSKCFVTGIVWILYHSLICHGTVQSALFNKQNLDL